MTEKSMPWANNGLGDGQQYLDDDWSDWDNLLLTYDRTVEGVIFSMNTNYSGLLAVTNPAGMTIRVASGIGLVDGKRYSSTANVDLTVVTPGAGSNYYTVVLRKDWAAQTVRAALLGPNTVSYPTVTQDDVTSLVWEVALAHVRVTSGGVVTVTDLRRFCPYNDQVVAARQGGSATLWVTPGTNNYVLNTGRVIVQCGAGMIPLGSTGLTITFPIPFAHEPITIISPVVSNEIIKVGAATIYDVIVAVNGGGAAVGNINFHWMAIGQI